MNPTISLQQLGAITSALKEQATGTEGQYKFGVLSALSLVNAHANLQAQQNATAMPEAMPVVEELPATANKRTSKLATNNATSSLNNSTTNNSTLDMSVCSPACNCVLCNPNKYIDWKDTAAKLQAQLGNSEAELVDSKLLATDLRNRLNAVLQDLDTLRAQLAKEQVDRKNSQLELENVEQQLSQAREGRLNLQQNNNVLRDALANERLNVVELEKRNTMLESLIGNNPR